MKIFLLKKYSAMLLIGAKNPTLYEKLCYFLKILVALGPVVALLEALKLWFTNNANFMAGVLVALALNMVVGWWFHQKNGTFSWKEFVKGNIKMFFGVLILYAMLELLRYAAGNNVISEGFKIVVQVATMIWPVSKALKNLHLIFDRKFPPAFIMDRFYTFEKSGKLADLYGNDLNNNNEINNAG